MYNTKYFNIQISSIESTLEYINNKCDKEKEKTNKKTSNCCEHKFVKQCRCKINYNSCFCKESRIYHFLFFFQVWFNISIYQFLSNIY